MRLTAGPQWTAEREIGPGEAAALVGAQFPELAGLPVAPLATGWDNTVHRVGDEWIFRFPRRAIALDGVRREIAVLPRLAPLLPVPVPVPALVGAASERYPWPFWGARPLGGQELAEAGPPDAARERIAADTGRFLRALHDPRLAETPGTGLPYDPMGRADPAHRAAMARDWLDGLVAGGIWAPDPAVTRLFADGVEVGPATGPAVLSHGDLHARHVLVDGGRVSGVIDWGDVCLADPAVDLSIAYGAFAGGARAALLAAYGPVDPATAVRARVLAVSLCAPLAAYAAAQDRAALLAESLAGLRRAVAP